MLGVDQLPVVGLRLVDPRPGVLGAAAFLRDGDDVFRTYFTNARGVDRLRFDRNILDLTALGRQEDWEDTPDGWPRTEGRFEVIHRHQPAGPA